MNTSTHFNATEMLRQNLKQHKKLQVKVSQFLDAKHLETILTTLKSHIVTKEGRGGGTWLPNELLEHYQEWLKSVGIRHKQVDSTQTSKV